MKIIDFIKPESVEEALRVLHKLDGKAIVFAGGTAFQFLKGEDEKIAVSLDLDSLRGIKTENDNFIIGALTNISDLQEYNVKGWVLNRVAKKFSSQQIRNISTLGGNIAQVFPWSDFPVALLALDAEIAVSNGDNVEIFNAEKFFEKQPMSLLKNKLLVTEIKVPVLNKDEGFGYFKEVRTSAAFSTLTTAAYIKCEKGLIKKLRVAVGVALGMPRILTDIEFELKDKEAEEKLIMEIIQDIVKKYSWKGKEGSTDEYAAHLADVRLQDVILEALSYAKVEVE